MLAFPYEHFGYRMGYKFTEFTLFFLGPVVIQSILYAIICKQLFVGTKELHRRPAVNKTEGSRVEKESDAIRARKGVVKMLIASVMVYFFSYAPAQLPLIYNTISSTPFNQNWSFLVLVMTLGYVNSAANPILYCIFSQNFRRCFRRALCSCLLRKRSHKLGHRGSPTGDTTSMGTRGVVRFGSVRGHTATTALISEA